MYRFDEMGRYDLPAVFNHVLNVTGRPKLSYIAFSMGNLKEMEFFMQ